MPGLKKKLASLATQDLFKYRGVVDLSQYMFLDANEVDSFKDWLNNQNFLTSLQLTGCNLCERLSIRSIFVDDKYGDATPSLITHSLQSMDIMKPTRYTKSDVVAKILTQITGWLVINLSQNNLAQKESETILKAVTLQAQLRHLDFSFNSIGDEGIHQLTKMLAGKTSVIKSLNLRHTNLTKSSLKKIISALEKNKSIREIDLGGNDIDNTLLTHIKKVLENNKTVVKIDLESDSLDRDLIKTIAASLERNISFRRDLHAKLLSRDNLKAQAFSAVNINDTAWLSVLIGLNKKFEVAVANYDNEIKASFKNFRKHFFFTDTLVEQCSYLQKINSTDVNDQQKLNIINEELNIIINTKRLRELECYNDFYLEKVQIKTEVFIAEVIEPCCKLLALQINENTDLTALLQVLEKRKNQSYKDAEIVKAYYDDIQIKHTDYIVKRYQLLETVKKLDLGLEFAQEREELEERLIEVHIDPDCEDDKGNTLLHVAYERDHIECVKFLLAKGANILHKNHNDISVFKQVINNVNSKKCAPVIIQFIQKRMDKVWFDVPAYSVFREELYKFSNIKKLLDEYLNVLLNNIEMPIVLQIMTGVYHHLIERSTELENYYTQVMLASKQNEKNPLAQILKNMLQSSQIAKRGLRNSSTLHDGVVKRVIPLLRQLNSQYYEVRTQLERLEGQDKMNATSAKENEEIINDFQIIEPEDIEPTKSKVEKKESPLQILWKNFFSTDKRRSQGVRSTSMIDFGSASDCEQRPTRRSFNNKA